MRFAAGRRTLPIMTGTGLPGSEPDAPAASQHKVTGAWAGYLIFALILLFLIVIDAQFAYEREWRSFTGAAVFTLAFLIIPTGGLKWLRRSAQARKRFTRSGDRR